MTKLIAHLEHLIKLSPNTKSEIKNAISELSGLVKLFERGKEREVEIKCTKITTETQTEVVGVSPTSGDKMYCDAGTQTISGKEQEGITKSTAIWGKLGRESDVGNLIEISKMDWPQIAFKRTRLDRRSIVTYEGVRAVLVDPEEENSIYRNY